MSWQNLFFHLQPSQTQAQGWPRSVVVAGSFDTLTLSGSSGDVKW